MEANTLCILGNTVSLTYKLLKPMKSFIVSVYMYIYIYIYSNIIALYKKYKAYKFQSVS